MQYPSDFVNVTNLSIKKFSSTHKKAAILISLGIEDDAENSNSPILDDWTVFNTIFLTTQTYLLKVLVS